MATDTDRIRHELEDLAGAAPRFTPRGSTWSRARRARRRDLVLVVVSAVVGIACLGSLLLVVGRGSPEAGPATPPDLDGVPARIWSVPDRFVQNLQNPPADERTWDPRIAEGDLAVGRGAAAFVSGDYAQLPVVVTARDGRYHPLDLPGYSPAAPVNQAGSDGIAPLALAPDGSRLAYGWWDPTARLDRPMPSGIRVVDLTTGSITTYALAGGNGIQVASISWSPDSRWLAWSGGRSKSWTPMSSTFGPPVAGRVSPAGTVDYLPGRLDDFVPVAITNAGLLAAQDGGRTRLWDGGAAVRTVGRSPRDTARYASAWSPSGDQLALTTFGPAPALEVVSPGAPNRTAALPEEPFRTGTDKLQPLGWIDDRTVVVRIDPRPDGSDVSDSRVALLRSDGRGGTTVEVVGRVQHRVEGLTVATRLMNLEDPTVQRPAPRWPWSDQRITLVVALAALLVVAIGVGLTRWRRRTAGPFSTRQRLVGRWVVGLGSALAVGYVLTVAVANGGTVGYRLDRSTGTLGFSDDLPRFTGLPPTVRAEVDYPVRVLVPQAAVGSHLQFTAFASGSPGRLVDVDISLCRADVSGAPTAERCRITDAHGRFAYAAPGTRELPAVLRFTSAQVGTELRLQYQVIGPRSPWNPFGGRSERVYVLGRVVPAG